MKCTYVNYILLVCTPGAGEGRTDAGVHRRGWRGCGVRTMCDARAPLMRRWLPSGLLRPLVAALAISGRAGAQFDNDAGDISVHTTQLATSRAGYATYQVAVGFDTTKVEDVYALFGDESIAPINVPPAYQVSAVSLSLSLRLSLSLSPSLSFTRARARARTREGGGSVRY